MSYIVDIEDINLNKYYPHICADWVKYMTENMEEYWRDVLINKIKTMQNNDKFDRGIEAYEILKNLYFQQVVPLASIVSVIKTIGQDNFIGFKKLNFGLINRIDKYNLIDEMKKVKVPLKLYVRGNNKPKRLCQVIRKTSDQILDNNHFACLDFKQKEYELSVNSLIKYKKITDKIVFNKTDLKIDEDYSFIFKTAGHLSTSHIDVDKPPYVFITSQISGESKWRFYSVFLGEYINYLANYVNKRAVRKVINEVEKSYSHLYKDITLRAGESILVYPDSCHEVLTPISEDNIISAACAVEINLPQWVDHFKFENTEDFIKRLEMLNERDAENKRDFQHLFTDQALHDLASGSNNYSEESTIYEKSSVPRTENSSGFISAGKHNKKQTDLKEIFNFADTNKNFRDMLKDLYNIYKRHNKTFVEYETYGEFFNQSVRIHYTFGETTLASANKDLREGRVSAVAKNVIKNIGKRKNISKKLQKAAEELCNKLKQKDEEEKEIERKNKKARRE